MATGLYTGWVTLSGAFPPSLNKRDDEAALKPFESPDCYGAEADVDGFMKTGSVLQGDTRKVKTNSFVGKSWEWYYRRSWHDTGSLLEYTAPGYDDADHRQGLGKLVADTDVVNFMPAFGSAMWVVTGKGSHLVQNIPDERGFYSLDNFRQEFLCDSAAQATTLDGIPHVCNKKGVFSFDGRQVNEITRPVRGDTAFTSLGIRPDYQKKFIVGADQFVIDASNGKLFSYRSAGFRFTSRQLVQPRSFAAFSVTQVGFIVEMSSSDDGSITYQTKLEDEDWEDRDEVKVQDNTGMRTRVVGDLTGNTTGHKYQIRITAMSSNIKVREIQLNVRNLARGAIGE